MAQYSVTVPTLSNAAAGDFVVSVQTTTPSIWFVSNLLSGQSLDNLAPAQPAGITAAYSGGQTNLQWTPNAEADLASYAVYRGSAADFTPAPGNRIGTPGGASYADVGPAGNYYKLSALDVNGNESTFALITPEQTADVGGGGPVVFDLEGVFPNPTRGAIHVRFALPTHAPARLELVDVAGRRVRTLEQGMLPPGEHTRTWDGRTERSAEAPMGTYVVVLRTSQGESVQRIAVVR